MLTADGSGGNSLFATAIDANGRMVAASSTAAAQLMMTTAIAAATIGQRSHCHGCHYVIVPPSHHRLRQRQPPLTKITIAAATINRRL
jgi:hypothetical protein